MRLLLGVLCLGALLPPAAGSAQTLQGGDSVLATPRQSYDASGFRATMMGHGWRELWRVPVMTQVLDLDEFAGGLTVVRRGGGKQTSSLRMQGEDSDKWHRAYRGGLRFSFLRQHSPLISATVATADEATRVLIGLGFSF